MNTENKKWYFGGGDPYGDNDPGEFFYNNILPLLSKYKIKNKDLESIVKNIQNMVDASYSNGYDSCNFDLND